MLAAAECITFDSTRQEHEDTVDSRENGRHDPAVRHAKRQRVPIVWGRGTCANNGLGDRWEEQARFGLNGGLCSALYLPEGRHAICGVESDRPVPTESIELT